MHQLPIEQQVLLAAQIAVLGCLCLRMWLTALHRVYPSFFMYLLLDLLQALIPIFVPLDSRLYRDLYVASQALIIVFYALVVLEVYSVVFQDLRGIATTARRFIKGTLIAAIVVSMVPLLVEKPPNTLTGYLFLFQRPVLSSLVVFVLLMSGFLVYYPIVLGRNSVFYLAGYALYFVTIATTTFVNNLGYFWNRQLGTVRMSISLACLLLWLFALSRQGEKKAVVVGHQWNADDEQRLMAQLEAINASLLRSGRK